MDKPQSTKEGVNVVAINAAVAAERRRRARPSFTVALTIAGRTEGTMASPDNNIALLAEINRLIQTAPAAAVFYEDIPERHAWLGEVENALRLWDPARSAGMTVTISHVFDRTMRDNSERPELMIKLGEARRSLEMRMGLPAHAYVQPTEPVRAKLQAEAHLLRKAVQESNTVDSDNRNMLLSEIAIFEATIIQPRISSDLIQRFVGTVLKGAAMRLAGASADQIADRIVTILWGLLVAQTLAQ